jgi:wobble nucleotide-excising tRNase
MNIIKIDKLKALGIFSDYTAQANLENFLKFNLFYGWNGSGKTTLSKLLFCLQKDATLPSNFSGSEFKISTDRGEITNRNLKRIENLSVFNEDFIKENIDWNDRVKSILLISKEKITAIEELKKEREAHAKVKKELEDDSVTEKETEDRLQNILSLTAKQIKQSFQTIGAKESYYNSYDKKKFLDFLSKEKENIQNPESILSDKNLNNLIENIKPNEKDIIVYNFQKPELKTLYEVEKRLVDLLKTSITSGVIEKLKNNSDIASWVESGLRIHQKHGEEKCEFCGNAIDPKRLLELNKHFSDELSELRKKLEYEKGWIEENIALEDVALEESLFYADLQDQFILRKTQIGKEIRAINKFVDVWLLALSEKISNPSKEILLAAKIPENFLTNIEREVFELETLIISQNLRIGNFDLELKKNQKKLELHYGAEFEKNFQYFKALDDLRLREDWREAARKLLREGVIKLAELEGSLSNETLGATLFNKTLARFVGYSEIELKFSEPLKGYQIIRKHNGALAKNLSEGEKTAIAFVYFITKLREKESLKDDIVVLDDPISSFDSNNLFSAYSFIKAELEEARQLFVFTHNFTFFRLIRDWFKGKNGRKEHDGTPRDDKSRFYLIKVSPSFPRASVIENIDQSLINYDSEYHFVFSRLYIFKDQETLSLEESFQVANLSRKLLESFLSFKFPKKRNDFKVLFDVAFKKLDLPEEEKRQKGEKIFNFINKYSHLQTIYFGGDDESNQLGETSNIVKEVLGVVEANDDDHYREMVELLALDTHDNEE